jgi:uncharacterized repeat protein (TIGR01451 family)
MTDLHAAGRTFAQRAFFNVNGDFVIIGNTAMSCSTTSGLNSSQCATAQNPGVYNPDVDNSCSSTTGTASQCYNDNYFNMISLQPTSATLNMPAGATPIFAALFWGAMSDTSGAGEETVTLASPGFSGSVSHNVGSTVDFFDDGTHDRYGGMAILDPQSITNGPYTVSDIKVHTGSGSGSCDISGCYGGWGLLVVYSEPTLPLRNISVFDGYQCVSTGDCDSVAGTDNTQLEIPVSGFLTPLSGPVATRLGVLAYEGDRARFATDDDFFEVEDSFGTFQALTQSDAFGALLREANNFFNSSITDDLGEMLGRTPSDNNQFGFDIANISMPSGFVINGQTSATFRARSGGDLYFPSLLVFRTDLHTPIIAPNIVKTMAEVNDTSGGTLLPGDRLRYRIALSNTGYDTATEVTIVDNIPANTTYLSDSLLISDAQGTRGGASSAAGGAPNLTDVSLDDQAEYISTGTLRTVFRVGQGANATTGGNLPQNASAYIEFDVTVNTGISAGTTLFNAATVSYSGQTTSLSFGASSSELTTQVMSPPVVTKSFSPVAIASGGPSLLTIRVTNPGTNPSNPDMQGVSFTDNYAPVQNTATANPVVCATSDSSASVAPGTGLVGGNTLGMTGGVLRSGEWCEVSIYVTVSETTPAQYTNTIDVGEVTTTNAGSNTVAASATLAVGLPGISKAFGENLVLTGQPSQITFVLTNPTNAAMTNVTFSDPLPTGLVVASTPNASYSGCGTGGVFNPNPPPSGATTLSFGDPSQGNGTILALSTCTITVDVVSDTGNSYDNTTTGVSTTVGTGPPSNTATLIVVTPPMVTKSFSPPAISATPSGTPSVNGITTLTIVVTNSNPSSTNATFNGVLFTDSYPSGTLTNYAAPSISCTPNSSATVTGLEGESSVGMSDGTILPDGSCTVTVQVIGSASGTYLNSTGNITTSNAGTGAEDTAGLVVSSLAPPTVSKSFSLTTIAEGGTSTLTVTLANSNAGDTLTGVAFTDNLPAGIEIATSPPPPSGTCIGTISAIDGDDSFSFSGGTIPAAGNCTVIVTVTGVTAGSFVNTIPVGGVISANAPTNTASGQATLNVVAPPTITKSFDPLVVAGSGSTSTLTITLANPPVNTGIGGGTALTGVNFSDTFPTGMTHSSTTSNGCGGTLTILPGSSGISLSGVTLATNASCTVVVVVSVSTTGNLTNTTGAVGSNEGGSGATASAVLGVGQPGITKSFLPTQVLPGTGVATLTVTLENPTGSAMTSAAFTDIFPSGMSVAPTPNASTTCVGGVLTDQTGGAIGTGDTGIALGLGGVGTGTIPLNGDCTVTVDVVSTLTGANTIPAGGLTVAGGLSNGAPASAVLSVTQPIQATKSFSPATILECPSPCSAPVTSPPAFNQVSVMTITLTNPSNAEMSEISFTDIFPIDPSNPSNQMLVNPANGGNVTSTCGNASNVDVSPPTELVFGLSGTPVPVSLGAGVTCTITVEVIATGGALTYTNTTGEIGHCEMGEVCGPTLEGPAATATLTVMKPLTVEKFFSQSPIFSGQTATLTIRLTNLNSVDVTGVQFTDTYPTGLVNTIPSSVQTNCPGGVVTGVSGADTVSLAGALVEAFDSCEVSVVVTSNTVGSYDNTIPGGLFNAAGEVDTTNAGSSPSTTVSATLDVILGATATKQFIGIPSGLINQLGPNDVSATLKITLTNPGATAIGGVSFTDVYQDPDGAGPAAPMTNQSPGPVVSNTCGGTATTTNVPPSLSLLDGAIPPGGCEIMVTVVIASVGVYPNDTGLMTTSSPIGTIPSASATLEAPIYIYGTVYNDTNHNSNLETTEGGTGLSLCAKLILGGVVVDVGTVDPVTGDYVVSHPAQGTYSIVIDSDNCVVGTTDMTPTIPAGWIGTEAPTQVRTGIVVPINQKAVFDQDFGLFNGIKLTGTVFQDDGGGGTANDGIQTGTEAGIGGVVVQAQSASCLGSICDSTTTDAVGDYVLYVPASVATAGGTDVEIVELSAAGYISTGGSPGTTGGTYDRPSDTTTFSFATAEIGTTYTDVDFADVPVNTFIANGAQTALPGTVVFYAHTFTPGTAGSVTFSSSEAPSPVVTGWSSVIYRDDNCNGILDGTTETTVLISTTSIPTTEGVPICIITKVFIPAAAPTGAQDVTTVTAEFTYTNASPALLTTHTVTDLTTVGTPTSAGLILFKEVDKASALPDETLAYTLTYTNNSSEPLNGLVITDATPAHTTFVSNSATCTPPSGMTCTIVQPNGGATGGVTWTLTGSLAPGASGTVTYSVVIE